MNLLGAPESAISTSEDHAYCRAISDALEAISAVPIVHGNVPAGPEPGQGAPLPTVGVVRLAQPEVQIGGGR